MSLDISNIKFNRIRPNGQMMQPSRAQHDTLSKKDIVIFDNNDATGLDNQVIDRSG